MTRVFVSHPSDKLAPYFGPRATEALQAIAEVRFNPEPRELSIEALIEAAQGCDALIAYRQTPGPERLFRALPQLAAFLRCAVDIRTVDVEAASAHGVLVTQASPGYVAAVAEWILAVMTDLGRGIGRYARAYQDGRPLAPFMGRQLRGSTLGVIGYGQIGQYLGELALAFGMRVLASDPQPIEGAGRAGLQQVALPALLSQSDFVVCLAPANAATERLMDAAAFAAMQRGAFFVNAARGELVDDEALLAALESGHLAGCAIDVGRAPDQMPDPALARHPQVIATPHIGGLTLPAIEHQALETVAQLHALLRGELPEGAVNAAHADRWRRWPGTGAAR
ncbi:NAD(P)-dependent oxidoreductase [Variovorax sp. J31P207]|uniref:NAD(P)-dependent oxidoreductase n=1 Tax=Variovorax sp. J31P207 TaxID=3053510 RepID=UPI0025786318|nr:NAD(P)-dependent oxidoreductase [Variovorax sp. J31P207]MDM0068076.1 NAD(P)-dependent oxidoreductase [Variovorax sp. J31P207]